MHEYFVYIVRCSDGTYCTGVTNNLELRFCQHQDGMDPSCYTFKRRPLTLVYAGSFCDVHEAIAWEKRVKRWSRRKKEALIRRDWDALPDLSLNTRLKNAQKNIAMVRSFVPAQDRLAHHDNVLRVIKTNGSRVRRF